MYPLTLVFLQMRVPANRNNVVLQNLDPDTPYNIKVTAIYNDGPGGELEGNGRTCMYTLPILYVWIHKRRLAV